MNYDIKLSSDGDLVLGQQQLDEEGFFLYYKKVGEEEVEITRDPDGNTPIRDMEAAYGEDAAMQLIKSRLQTDNPDWHPYPNVGANLSDLIGSINSPKTAEIGKDMILRALTYDGAFETEDIEVEVIPVSANQILFDIRLVRDARYLRYPVIFDFETGLLNDYQ